ncbi:PhoP/PhoQ regulator MgrB [Morganella psychrotolerans]|uniref:PhoP/PhoQ regulator MgrB n=1 Tax=Morganella psychrotolerans TaxID=368603 RepID=UPI000AB22EE6|nr:PhoP/PhoQ regulator MgrB [Morganella psychrotolerans]
MKKTVIILLLIVAGVFFYIAALDKYCDQREDFMLGICEITKFIPSDKGDVCLFPLIILLLTVFKSVK